MGVEERKRKKEREKVNDYSGTIVSERRRWRTHTLGPILEKMKTVSVGKMKPCPTFTIVNF